MVLACLLGSESCSHGLVLKKKNQKRLTTDSFFPYDTIGHFGSYINIPILITAHTEHVSGDQWRVDLAWVLCTEFHRRVAEAEHATVVCNRTCIYLIKHSGKMQPAQKLNCTVCDDLTWKFLSGHGRVCGAPNSEPLECF